MNDQQTDRLPLEWLNYHHLLYFWMVAREGSIARASERLQLSQPTISAQLRSLERSLGMDLFRREGRSLVLTEPGQLVLGYADEIFTLGRELVNTLKSRPTGRPLRLTVGIADVVPKPVAYRLLKPAFEGHEQLRIICREGKSERLLAELAAHRLDIVFSDCPYAPEGKVKAFNHLLEECGIILVATAQLAERYRQGFPASLDGAPFLVPSGNTMLNRELHHWFEAQEIQPEIRGEFEDSALLRVFGQAGHGIFPILAVSLNEIQSQFQIQEVGRIETIRERFYAVTLHRRIKHPAVAAICDAPGPDPAR